MRYTFILALLSLTLLTGCANCQKHLDAGDEVAYHECKERNSEIAGEIFAALVVGIIEGALDDDDDDNHHQRPKAERSGVSNQRSGDRRSTNLRGSDD